MAVRFNCPIFTYEFILDAAGVILEDSEDGGIEEQAPTEKPKATSSKKSRRKKTVSGNTLSSYTADELSKMLEEVLDDEDYERAAKIRDEITRREGRAS